MERLRWLLYLGLTAAAVFKKTGGFLLDLTRAWTCEPDRTLNASSSYCQCLTGMASPEAMRWAPPSG